MENNKQKFSPDEMVKQADELLLKEMKEGKYSALLETMDTLGTYTLRNQMLILSQNPKATKVNNMQAWNYQKRSIKPGEKSLKILAPTFAKQVTANNDGSVTEKTLDKVTGYEVRFVFDFSQTQGEPLKDILDADISIDKYELITTALKESAKGFEFGESNGLEEGTDALLDTDSKTITLREGLGKDTALKTLINQIAAANILMRDRRHFRGLNSYEMQNIMGVEISGVSYSVGKRLGLELTAAMPDFKDMADENIGKFADNIGVIRSVSQKMIAAVENAISYQVQAEKDAKEKSEAAIANKDPAPKANDIKQSEQKIKKSKQAINSKTEAAL